MHAYAARILSRYSHFHSNGSVHSDPIVAAAEKFRGGRVETGKHARAMTTLQPRESPSRTANGVAFVSSLQPSSRKPSPVLPPKTRPTEEEEEVSDDVSSNDEAPHAEPVSTSGRKRAHPPAELDIDGSPAPNKRLHTPTVSR